LFDQATWEFINSFADWFSAVGTIAAVIAALSLARQDRRVRLRVNAGSRVMVSQNPTSTPSDQLLIGITNIGHREAQISNIGWKVGIFKKKFSIQTPSFDAYSSSIPSRLRDGEEARFLIPLDDEIDWLGNFVQQFLKPYPKVLVHFVWVQAHTSVGKTFEARIEKSLRIKLIEASVKASQGSDL
jgi:hypothetical protein